MKFIKQPNFTPPNKKYQTTNDIIIYYCIKSEYTPQGERIRSYITDTIAVYNNTLGKTRFHEWWPKHWKPNKISKLIINQDTFKNLKNPPQILI